MTKYCLERRGSGQKQNRIANGYVKAILDVVMEMEEGEDRGQSLVR